MAKDENKAAREEGKSSRRAAAETAEVAPLVSCKRGKFQTLESAKIEAPVFMRFADYKAFVAEMEGEEPEDGAIISAGLEMLFAADKGFERWMVEQRRKGRNGGGANGSGANSGSENAVASLASNVPERSRRAEAVRSGE